MYQFVCRGCGLFAGSCMQGHGLLLEVVCRGHGLLLEVVCRGRGLLLVVYFWKWKDGSSITYMITFAPKHLVETLVNKLTSTVNLFSSYVT